MQTSVIFTILLLLFTSSNALSADQSKEDDAKSTVPQPDCDHTKANTDLPDLLR
jgi:hypothetical protein